MTTSSEAVTDKLLFFYECPQNQERVNKNGKYDKDLWEDIFVLIFDSRPSSTNDPLWDILLFELNALKIHSDIIQQLNSTKSEKTKPTN